MTTDPRALAPGASLVGTGLTRTCLYQLDGDSMLNLGPDRPAVEQWCRDHGLDPARITTSAPLLIYREPDDRPFVTCRIVDDPPQPCEGCSNCIRSQAVWVPWNGVMPPTRLGWRAPRWQRR